MQHTLRIVVTGEVNAGKSTLIGRFLYEAGALSKGATEEIADICQRLGHNFEFAYFLDSFEEERRSQLTIDTTQAFCKIKKGREFVFIDVPGHRESVKNMLCGSSYADIAILIVDIQKSIEEQTKRHAFILKLFGIKQIVIVLNKMDSVGFNENIFKKVKGEAVEFLKKLQLQPKYFIPVSAKLGENLFKVSKKMAWYKGLPLVDAINTYFKKERDGLLCFPVQDIYGINKERLAVGNLISGEVKKGDTVNILPLNRRGRVKTIHVLNKKLSFAKAPASLGLMLDDMNGLQRGQIICKSAFPKAHTDILAKILCMRPLRIKENLLLKCLTQETTARIDKINGVWDIARLESKPEDAVVKENEVAEVKMTTEDPVVLEAYEGVNSLGRFVLENNQVICAVGISLEK